MRCNTGCLEPFSTVGDSRFQLLKTDAAAAFGGLLRME
jgi:hypothetical protein